MSKTKDAMSEEDICEEMKKHEGLTHAKEIVA